MLVRWAGSPIAEYARVQCREPKTRTAKVSTLKEDETLCLSGCIIYLWVDLLPYCRYCASIWSSLVWTGCNHPPAALQPSSLALDKNQSDSWEFKSTGAHCSRFLKLWMFIFKMQHNTVFDILTLGSTHIISWEGTAWPNFSTYNQCTV